jgi:hypothetical protein
VIRKPNKPNLITHLYFPYLKNLYSPNTSPIHLNKSSPSHENVKNFYILYENHKICEDLKNKKKNNFLIFNKYLLSSKN